MEGHCFLIYVTEFQFKICFNTFFKIFPVQIIVTCTVCNVLDVHFCILVITCNLGKIKKQKK